MYHCLFLISFLFGKSAKKQMLTQPRFKRSLPTVKQFKITHEPNFEEARKQLIEMVSQYAAEGHGAIQPPEALRARSAK